MIQPDSTIKLDPTIKEFCLKPEDYNLCLKNNVLFATRKIFLISRLMRWLLPSYNFCYILNELGQKFIDEKEEVTRSQIIEKIASKKKNYLTKKRCIRISEERKRRVNSLFQKVENLGKLQSLFTDEEFRTLLGRFNIQIDPAKEPYDVFLNIEEEIENGRFSGVGYRRIYNTDFRENSPDGSLNTITEPFFRKPRIDSHKPFFEDLYQRDFIQVFSFVVEREDSETDGQYVKRIKEVLASDQIPSIRSLFVKDKPIAHLPEEIKRFTSLEELDLAGKWRFGGFPKQVCDLPNLKCLGLYDNGLKALPEEIKQLTSLEALDLSGNLFNSLPKQVCDLPKLKYLGLYNNGLKALPEEIKQLTSLEGLDLSGNLFNSLPKQVCDLLTLNYLNLSGINLRTLPEEIGQLTSLAALDLSEMTWLESFPEQICNLPKLKYLNLSGTRFESLPKQLCNLPNLEQITLIDAKIKNIPEEITQKKSLEIIFHGSTHKSECYECI